MNFFEGKSTFLAVKVRKEHLDLEFSLDHPEGKRPVSRWMQTSKHRVVHVVPIAETVNTDAQLKQWMKQSFELIECG